MPLETPFAKKKLQHTKYLREKMKITAAVKQIGKIAGIKRYHHFKLTSASDGSTMYGKMYANTEKTSLFLLKED